MDIALIIVLILSNGIFAMAEMALVSSGKARLQKLADEQRAGAQTALKLRGESSRFLSTIQIGITSIGILSGALGEDALTQPLQAQLVQIPWLQPYAENLALVATVILLTYFSVVIGELVPKRLALKHPEAIASAMAPAMNGLAFFATPLVWFLSLSGNLLLRILGAHKTPQATVTNEEINILMGMGSQAGVFHASEGRLVSNVLKLDEQRVGAIMTPRKDIFAIDLNEGNDVALSKIASCPYARAVICRDGLENILGVLNRSDLLKTIMASADIDILNTLSEPLYVPDSLKLPHLIEVFRQKRTDFALIVNEYGTLEGLVTLSDLLEAIVGGLPAPEADFDTEIMQRTDGSWLVDGSLSIARLKSAIGISGQFPGEASNAFNTVGGFILFHLEKIPRVTDNFVYGGWHFEVVDIDGTRIDKVLVAKQGDTKDS